MVRVKPFHGIRPKAELAAEVSALPYDVMNREEAKVMAEGTPVSFSIFPVRRLIFPTTSVIMMIVFMKKQRKIFWILSKRVSCSWRKNLFIILSGNYGRCCADGLVAAVAVEDYENGAVMKHELTRKEKEQDRIRHFGRM